MDIPDKLEVDVGSNHPKPRIVAKYREAQSLFTGSKIIFNHEVLHAASAFGQIIELGALSFHPRQLRLG